MTPRVFVSYSRHDFYFAEALTAELAATGRVRPWLDVANLRPGTDWSTAIDTALDESDALVLVTSPAAMRSPYVRDEWQRALAADKPIHLALVRRTRLPDELARFPVHDLRGDTRAAAARLAELPPTGHRSIPFAWPVALVHVALLLGVLGSSVGAVFGWHLHDVFSTVAGTPGSRYEARYAQFSLAMAMVDALIAVGLAGLAVRFARRSAPGATLRLGLHSQFAALFLTLVVGGLHTDLHAYRTFPDPGPLRAASASWPYLVGLVAALVGIRLVRRSRVLRLRMPTGEDEQGVRPPVVRSAVPGPPRQAATYEVLSQFADTPIAGLFAAVCDQAGLRGDRVDPTWRFFLVSSRTDPAQLPRLREVFGPRLVFVQATSVRLPEDSHESRRYQWIDFRRQDLAELQAQLRDIGAVPTTVPVAPDRFRVPSRVEHFLRVAQGLVAFTAAAPLAQFVAGSTARVIPAGLIAVLLAAVLLPLAVRTATRDITAARWRARAVLVCAVFAAWSLFPITTGDGPLLLRIVVSGLLVTSLAMLAVWLSGTLRVVERQWLPPARTMPAPHLSPPVAPPLGRLLSGVAMPFCLGYVHTLLLAW